MPFIDDLRNKFPQLQTWSDKEVAEDYARQHKIDLPTALGDLGIKQNKGLGGDIVTGLKRGVEQLPGAVTGLADLPFALAGGERPFSQAADWVGEKTGFRPGRWAEDAALQYSPEYQQGSAAIDQAWDKGSAFDIAKAYATNPRNTLGTVVESLPSMVGGGVGIGRRALLAGSERLAPGLVGPTRAGLLERTVGERMAAPVAAGIGEGAVTTGQQMDQYTGPDQQRNALAALGAGVGTAAIGVGAGRLAQRFGLENPEVAMTRGFQRDLLQEGEQQLPAWQRIGGGALSEGLLQELPQSMHEQAMQNIGAGKPWNEGIVRAGVEGGLAGVGMGAAFNIRNARVREQLNTNQPVDLLQFSSGNPMAPDFVGPQSPGYPGSPNFEGPPAPGFPGSPNFEGPPAPFTPSEQVIQGPPGAGFPSATDFVGPPAPAAAPAPAPAPRGKKAKGLPVPPAPAPVGVLAPTPASPLPTAVPTAPLPSSAPASPDFMGPPGDGFPTSRGFVGPRQPPPDPYPYATMYTQGGGKWSRTLNPALNKAKSDAEALTIVREKLADPHLGKTMITPLEEMHKRLDNGRAYQDYRQAFDIEQARTNTKGEAINGTGESVLSGVQAPVQAGAGNQEAQGGGVQNASAGPAPSAQQLQTGEKNVAATPAQTAPAQPAPDDDAAPGVYVKGSGMHGVADVIAARDQRKGLVFSLSHGLFDGNAYTDVQIADELSKMGQPISQQRVGQLRKEAMAMADSIVRENNIPIEELRSGEAINSQADLSGVQGETVDEDVAFENAPDEAALSSDDMRGLGREETDAGVQPEPKERGAQGEVSRAEVIGDDQLGAAAEGGSTGVYVSGEGELNKINEDRSKQADDRTQDAAANAITTGNRSQEAIGVWNAHAQLAGKETWDKLGKTPAGIKTRADWLAFYAAVGEKLRDLKIGKQFRETTGKPYFMNGTTPDDVTKLEKIDPFTHPELVRAFMQRVLQGQGPKLAQRLSGVFLSDSVDAKYDAYVEDNPDGTYSMVLNRGLLNREGRFSKVSDEALDRAVHHEIEHLIDNVAYPEFSNAAEFGRRSPAARQVYNQLSTNNRLAWLFRYPMQSSAMDDATFFREFYAQVMSAYYVPKYRAAMKYDAPVAYSLAVKYEKETSAVQTLPVVSRQADSTRAGTGLQPISERGQSYESQSTKGAGEVTAPLWEVIDTRTGQPVKGRGPYASLRRASRAADKLDLEFGAHRYTHRRVEQAPGAARTGVAARLVEMFRNLAQVDGVFRNKPSNATRMVDIFRDIDPNFKVTPKEPDDAEQREGVVRKWHLLSPDGKSGSIKQSADGKTWVNVANFRSKQSSGGSVYTAVANYTANNPGTSFVGDPDGMSEEAIIRRTEHMTSAMLKYGDSAAIEPGDEQTNPQLFKGTEGMSDNFLDVVNKLTWSDNNDRALVELMKTSFRNAIHFNPEIAHVRYDFDAGQFVDARNGTALAERDIQRMADDANRRFSSTVGRRDAAGETAVLAGVFSGASIKRVALFHTLLRGASAADGGSVLADQISGLQSGGLASGAGIRGIYHAKVPAAPYPAGVEKTPNIFVQAVKDTVTHWAKTGLEKVVFAHDLADIAKKIGLKSAARFFELNNIKAATRTRLENDVDRIMDASATVSDRTALNTFLNDSTRDGKWGFMPTWRTDAKLDPTAVAQFNALSPAAQAVAKDVFRHGDTMYRTVRDLVDREINAEFDAMIARQPQRRAELEVSRAARLKTQERKMTIGNGPYAPLKRFGDYVAWGKSQAYLDAEDNDDKAALNKMQDQEQHYRVEFFNSIAEAKARQRELAREYAAADASVRQKIYRDIQEVPWGAIAKVRGAVNEQDGEDATKAALSSLLNDIYLTMLVETSARKSEMRRKKVAGESENMMRAFASQGRAMSHFIGALEHNGEIEKQLQAMRKEARGDSTTPAGTRNDRTRVLNEVHARYAQGMDYRPSPWSDKAMRVTSIWMLVTSPGYLFQNSLQPFMLTLPMLSGRFQAVPATAALFKAYGDIAPYLKSFGQTLHIDRLPISSDERAMLTRLLENGKLDLTISQDLGRWIDDDNTWSRSKFGQVMTKVMALPQKVEMVNRVTSALAAHRLSGGNYNYVSRVIDQTHGNYAASNAPRIMSGSGMAKLIFQFRKYQLIQVSLLGRLMHDAFAGASPMERGVARRTLTWLAAHHMVLAGTLGLPAVNLVGMVLTALGGDDDEPKDFERQMREWIGDKTTADLILRGVPDVAGIDLSSKIGMGNAFSILPYTDLNKLDRASYAKAAVGVLGPFFGGWMPQMVDGMGYMAAGDYYKGAEGMMPRGLRDAMRAYRFASEGVTNKEGRRAMSADEFSAFDVMAQAVGLPSTKVTDRTRLQGDILEMENYYRERGKELRHDYVRAYREGDTEAMADARTAWVAMQSGMSRNHFKVTPLSSLLQAPPAQAKLEKTNVGGVEVKRGSVGYAREIAAQ